MGVTLNFFKQMESLVREDHYKIYNISNSDGDIVIYTRKAWKKF